MTEIFRDPVWQFVGAILAIIAIVISIAIYYAQRKRKKLTYEIISKTSILSLAEEIEGKLKIIFEGEQVNQVHLLVIRLTNTGNTPITSKDYEREIKLLFGDTSKILTADVSETIPENLGATITKTEQEIILKPVLLNSGDAVTIKALISQFDGSVSIDGRVVGIKSIEKRKDNSALSIILMVLGIVFTFGAMFFLIKSTPRLETSPPPDPLFIIPFSLGYFFLLAGLLSNRRSRRIFMRMRKASV